MSTVSNEIRHCSCETVLNAHAYVRLYQMQHVLCRSDCVQYMTVRNMHPRSEALRPLATKLAKLRELLRSYSSGSADDKGKYYSTSAQQLPEC